MNKSNALILTTDNPALIHIMKKDRRMSWLIEKIGSLECSIHENQYAFVVEEIIGQMLSNKVAAIMTERLYSLCEGEVVPERVDRLGYNQLRSIGLSNSKTSYIQSFTKAVICGDINLVELDNYNDQEVQRRLTSIRGIGPWTAKMYMLFVLQRPDILPIEDVAFLQAFKWLYNKAEISKNELIEMCAVWKPYSSYAARYLYRALDSGLIKSEMFEE